jgi:hypothetical protein
MNVIGQMIFDLGPAVGFVSSSLPGGGTYTLTTYLGVFLRRAEQVAGPREPSWSILGIEFFGEERAGAVPHIWYPGDCGHVAIRLTRDAASEPAKALFQLAHEVCHLISPSGGKHAPNLEEGFATLLGHELALEHANFQCPVDPNYKEAYAAVVALLAHSPSAIRAIRRIEPRLWLVTPEVVEQAVPGFDRHLAEFLCASWATDAQQKGG